LATGLLICPPNPRSASRAPLIRVADKTATRGGHLVRNPLKLADLQVKDCHARGGFALRDRAK